MKKIDFHIHTISTISDSEFQFSLSKLQEYVENAELNAIAITNHDLFDKEQFEVIDDEIAIKVFPGIEINLEKGHLLLISDENILEFSAKCEEVSNKVQHVGDFISIEELKQMFGDLSNYLLIPHFDKKPELSAEVISHLEKYIEAGEVNSPKKFIRAIKNESKLTPVFFSDVRISENLNNFPTRHTYVDCGEITLPTLKTCLKDKAKVALSEENGNKLFQVFDNGQKLSTGLNVILGGRSSGKTFTLNRMYDEQENVQYIKQFSLVQQDEKDDEKKFNKYLNNQQSLVSEDFLKEFRVVLNEILQIDLEKNDKDLTQYLESLIKSATEAEKKDVFSKTALFDEVEFKKSETKILVDLINSVRMLIENLAYKELIEKHLNKENLQQLTIDLIESLWEKIIIEKKKKL